MYQPKKIEIEDKVLLEDVLSDGHGFSYFAAHCVNEFSVESILYLFELSILKSKMVEYGWTTNKEVDWNFEIAKDMIEPYSTKNLKHTNESSKSSRVTSVTTLSANKNEHHRTGSGLKKHVRNLSVGKKKVSSVSQTNFRIAECVHFIEYLYSQYVSDESVLMINISSNRKERLIQIMEHHKQDLFKDNRPKYSKILSVFDNVENLSEKDQIKKISKLKEVFKEYAKTGKEMYDLLSDSFLRFMETKEYKNWKATRKNKTKKKKDKETENSKSRGSENNRKTSSFQMNHLEEDKENKDMEFVVGKSEPVLNQQKNSEGSIVIQDMDEEAPQLAIGITKSSAEIEIDEKNDNRVL